MTTQHVLPPPATRRPRGQHPATLPGETTRPRGPHPVPAFEGLGGHRATSTTQQAWGGPRPLPPAPTRRQTTPAHLLGELAAELRALGLDHLHATAYRTEGVLSVICGITIWTNGHTLRCHTPLGTIPLPTSPHAAATQLAHLTGHAAPTHQARRTA